MDMCWKFKKNVKQMIHSDKYSILSILTKVLHVNLSDIAKIEAKRAMGILKELVKKTELSSQSVVATITSEIIYTIFINNYLIFLVYYYNLI